MAQEIHARKGAGGVWRYRIWCTVVDGYLSEELTEDELREELLKTAVCEAITNHLRSVDARIERTRRNGTSDRVGSKEEVEGPWKEEKEQS